MYAGHIDLDLPLYWTVEDVLSRDECAALIVRIDESKPEVAPINYQSGTKVNLSVRNNERATFDDIGLAQMLFERVRAHLPAQIMGMEPVGANERFRCYRYRPGQVFRAHLDGSFVRNEHERSRLTFMVYLNEVEAGGETTFIDLGKSVEPRAGRALLFQHRVLHEGSIVRAGVKYVLRSDIMCRRASQD